MKPITLEDIMEWGPCYNPERHLPEGWSGTVLDVLDLKGVPVTDKFWVVLRPALLPDKLLRLFAVWCARSVQHLMSDPRSIAAIDVAERFAKGTATELELRATRAAAEAGAPRDAQLNKLREMIVEEMRVEK